MSPHNTRYLQISPKYPKTLSKVQKYRLLYCESVDFCCIFMFQEGSGPDQKNFIPIFSKPAVILPSYSLYLCLYLKEGGEKKVPILFFLTFIFSVKSHNTHEDTIPTCKQKEMYSYLPGGNLCLFNPGCN